MAKIALRINTKLAKYLWKEVDYNINTLINNLEIAKTPEEKQGALKKPNEIFKNMEIQNTKKFILHSIGIVSLIITMIGLSILFFGLPLVIPASIIMVGVIASIAQYVVSAGLVNQIGWKFSWYDVILPLINIILFIPRLFKKIYKNIKEEKAIPNEIVQLQTNQKQSNNNKQEHKKPINALPHKVTNSSWRFFWASMAFFMVSLKTESSGLLANERSISITDTSKITFIPPLRSSPRFNSLSWHSLKVKSRNHKKL